MSLAGCELSNLDLDKLSRSLGELQRLDLTRCYGFSDEGLDKLYRFKHLVALHLEALSEEEWEEKTQSVSLSQGLFSGRGGIFRLPHDTESGFITQKVLHGRLVPTESSASSSQGSQSSTSSKGKKPPSHAVMFRTKIDTLQQLVDFCPELQLLDLARRPIGNTAFERVSRVSAHYLLCSRGAVLTVTPPVEAWGGGAVSFSSSIFFFTLPCGLCGCDFPCAHSFLAWPLSCTALPGPVLF